jgi:calpain-15
LSAIASIAEYSDRIKKIFLTKTINPVGLYVVRMCIAGEYCNIAVDDTFPYCNKYNNFAFSRAKGPELWVLILEKAWAKINGNYEGTICGVV